VADMPLRSTVGRRSFAGRVRTLLLYLALALGAALVVYPLLTVISGSSRSPVDLSEPGLIPRFIIDDDALYRKFVESLFNESVNTANIVYHSSLRTFADLQPPTPAALLVDEWLRFLQEVRPPPYAYTCGMVQAPITRTTPLLLRRFRDTLFRRFGGDLEALNLALGTDFVEWNALFVVPEDYYTRRRMPSGTGYLQAFWEFKERQPPGLCFAAAVEGFYKTLFLKTRYSRDIERYNRIHHTSYRSYDEIRLPVQYPRLLTPAERTDWEEFVRHTLNVLWIRVTPDARNEYHAYLKARYGDIAALNRAYGTSYTDFAQVPLLETPPFSGRRLEDWSDFISGWMDPDTGRLYLAPVESLRLWTLEDRFRRYLRRRFGTVKELNRCLGTSFADFSRIIPPQQQLHYRWFLRHRTLLRREFLTRNIRTVLDYVLVRGRAIRNTAIYCLLAVLGALVVNPLAAYALSRYRPASTYRWLLFMMLTMAFPPVVTQIPLFLLLRNLGLLNTFAALVLPGIAHGYSVFLLKGFFDSLPRELYESAALDGAGEWRMFRHITLALSGPILAVIALQAFTVAYTNFMFALLICQDPRMWTLMVWLYQLQQQSGQPVIYAALLVAAVPTLLVFLLCQRVILRGIIIPTEQ